MRQIVQLLAVNGWMIAGASWLELRDAIIGARIRATFNQGCWLATPRHVRIIK